METGTGALVIIGGINAVLALIGITIILIDKRTFKNIPLGKMA